MDTERVVEHYYYNWWNEQYLINLEVLNYIRDLRHRINYIPAG